MESGVTFANMTDGIATSFFDLSPHQFTLRVAFVFCAFLDHYPGFIGVGV